MTTISELPDYPAAAQLARALWQDGLTLRGAACLIGAGFSRNALVAGGDTPLPPLWPDLVGALNAQLYPGQAPPAFIDPLRLAEEYRAYFGQAALNDLIRSFIRDDGWRPGPTHEALLKLPWADVLTTNWDTLLERGARSIARPHYSVVRTRGDLGHARAPRIIKLHGTVGVSDHFIFAEEDYRTYPTRYAPFVNVARQVFIENELVLLGFSGDDPNFLQWAGWVRDHLGTSARRIYLVGVLNLGPAKRKLLESMNVAPIDLAPLVSSEPRDLQHTRATALFLDMLAASKPRARHEWHFAGPREHVGRQHEDWEREQKDDAYAASLIERAAENWTTDRQNYPGWLLCPVGTRRALSSRTGEAPFVTEKRFAHIKPERQLSVLYELAWRHQVALESLSFPDYKIFAEAVSVAHAEAEQTKSHAPVRLEHLALAALLLRTARVYDDEPEFAKWAQIVERYGGHDDELAAEAEYQRALWARDHLDFAGMLSNTASMKAARDPAWRLRLAALHSWRGEFEEAERLLAEAVVELNTRQTDDRTSIWLRSRRAWAQWLMQAAVLERGQTLDEPWSFEFKEIKADPWDEVEHIRNQAEKDVRAQLDKVKIRPLFLPGHFRDNSTTLSFRKSQSLPAYELEALQELVGLPERFGLYTLIEASAKDLVELAFEPEAASAGWYRRWFRVVSDHSDASVDRYLSRVRVALMDRDVAETIVTAVTTAVTFWRRRVQGSVVTKERFDSFEVSRLRFFIEILSRLTARQTAADARQSFALAVELAGDSSLRHRWLRERVGQLAEYAVRAIPPGERSAIVLDALHYPLPGEWGADFPGYASPVLYLLAVPPQRPQDDLRWTSRIAQLITEATVEKNRAEAMLRLIYLSEHGALTEDERQRTSQALWSQTDDGEPPLPRGTHLYPHVIANLPGTMGIDVEEVVRQRLFGPSSSIISGGHDPLGAITAAATAARPVLPSRDRALELFERITAWRPKPIADSFTAAFQQSEAKQLLRGLGPVLARGIVPALDPSDQTVERGRALLGLIDEASAVSALWALPFFVWSLDDDDSCSFIDRIKRGLLSGRFDEVGGAAAAVILWANLASQGRKPRPPAMLVEQICASLDASPDLGFDAVLQAARRLVKKRMLSVPDTARVAAALERLVERLSYEQANSDEQAAVTVSLARAECVRLAVALQESGISTPGVAAWLEIAARDPLPEVRFARDSKAELSD